MRQINKILRTFDLWDYYFLVITLFYILWRLKILIAH